MAANRICTCEPELVQGCAADSGMNPFISLLCVHVFWWPPHHEESQRSNRLFTLPPSTRPCALLCTLPAAATYATHAAATCLQYSSAHPPLMPVCSLRASKTVASPAAGGLLKSLWRRRLQLASRIERYCESKVGYAKQQRNCARPDGSCLAWLQPFGLGLCTIIRAARLRWLVRHRHVFFAARLVLRLCPAARGLLHQLPAKERSRVSGYVTMPRSGANRTDALLRMGPGCRH